MKNILVAVPYPKRDLYRLAAYSNLFFLREMSEKKLDAVLSSIDGIFVQFWPKELTGERLKRMSRLSFVQSGLAGVNHIPFNDIPPSVTVSSNAGGYSDEVGEFAWGLLLSGAKRILKLVRTADENASKSPLELGRGVVVLRGRVLGVLGYGGIGRSVARIGLAFGMKVDVLLRKETKREERDDAVGYFRGTSGLEGILHESDALVLALPLTKETKGMIGRNQLDMMKKDATLVNVARAEIIDQNAIYEHLVKNESFVYATDVWWTKEGKECYPPELPFLELPNFIGTPHVSGPSAVATGGPLKNSIDNLLRFVNGEPVRSVVRRSDYV